MSLDDFLQTVFLLPERDNSFENLSQSIQKNISALFPTNDQHVQITQHTGRLGPMAVSMNKSSVAGSLQYTEHDLEIESHSNFSSIRANVCVHKGKWMYEVTLGTAGIQQLGWAPIDCPFTNEEGVGDSPDSYAYDGKRIKKWNVSCANYGQAWTTGDVIGSCLDLDQGTLSFFRNGVSLGVAFSNIRAGENGPGLAYFPAVSLSYGERCYMNFGSRPFKYPVQDYLPLHISNLNSRSLNENIATYLLDSFVRLSSLQLHDPYVPLLSNTSLTTSTSTTTTTTTTSTSDINNNNMEVEFSNSGINIKSSLREDEATIIGSYIFDILGPLFQDEYLVCKVLIPYLEHFIASQKTIYLNKLINALFLFLEQHELKVCIDTIFGHLGYLCRTQSYVSLLENSSSSKRFLPLKLVIALFSIPLVLDSFLKLPTHSLYLEHYFTVKQPNVVDLSILIPVVWWQNNEEEICSKEKLEESFNVLSDIYTLHDTLLLQLSMLFLNKNSNNFNNDNSLISPSQSFRLWLRNIIKKNKGTTRNILPAGLSDSTVLSSLYFILLKLLNNYFTINVSDAVKNFPIHVFYDDTLDYYDFSRIGGTLSHLVKNMPIVDQNAINSKDGISLYDELFDDLVILYHLCMSSKFKQAALNHQNQVQTITQLEDTTKRIARARELNSEGVEHLLLAKKVFRDDVIDHIRLCTWHKVVLFHPQKQESMWDSVNFLVKLFSYFTNLNPLFSYVPEFYIESLIDTFHALRRGDPPFNLTDPKRLTELIDIIQFLIFHFDDKRIINPDLRDLLLQSISVLLQYQDFVKIFELPQVNGYHLIRQLLASFDTRFWSPISTILLRFWRGIGFGQPAKKANDCSSEIYQKYFRDLCSKESDVVDSYLNKIFNNLNWALTEFGVAAKEFQTALSRHFTEVQQFQRKCTVMFDFSFNLLRMLEFVAYESPATFLDSEMNLTRLTESLLFVLNRTTSGPDAKIFESLLKLDMAALDRINRAAILGPVAGIILNLAMSNGKFSLSTYFLSTGGFNAETLKFLTKFDWKKSITEENVILEEKLNKLSLFIKHVEKEAEELAASQSDKSELSHSASTDFCSICCAAPIDTYFVPCKHRSCNKCIKRHMLNSSKCFFCNAEITSTVLEEST